MISERELIEMIRPVAASLGWTPRRFMRQAAAELLEMARTPPENRSVPPLVRMADVGRTPPPPPGLPRNIIPFPATR